MELIMWGVAGLSVIATVANIHRRRWCFAVWAVTNAAWTVYDVAKTAYPQAALQAVYFGLAIWGLWAWRVNKEAK